MGSRLLGDAVEKLCISVHYIYGSSAQMDSFEKALEQVGINVKKTPLQRCSNKMELNILDD
jgi:cell division ATPase FtsA